MVTTVYSINVLVVWERLLQMWPGDHRRRISSVEKGLVRQVLRLCLLRQENDPKVQYFPSFVVYF